MFSPLQIASEYFTWWLRSSNDRGHGTHSPFVYDFIEKVLLDKGSYPAYSRVETLRRQLLYSHERIQVLDLGAGSRKEGKQERKIRDIVRFSAKPRKYGQLLYRMVRHYQILEIMELGTSLGLTTAYLAYAAERGRVLTMEGAPEIANMAESNFLKLGMDNIEVVIGDFDHRLEDALSNMPSPGLIYIDGNHLKEPTLRYFDRLLPHCGEGTVLVFDDIHWSKGMQEAWQSIKMEPQVRCTIDVFFMGIVFFRNSFREKQDFMIRY